MFRLFDQTIMVDACVLLEEPLCVRLAVQDLLRDIAKVSGRSPCLVDKPRADGSTLFIGTLTNASAARWVSEAQTATRGVMGQ